MRHLIALTVIGVLVLTAAAVGEDELVWQIGTKDQNFAEFAPTNDLSKFRPLFDAGIHFAIGKSDPKKDFSAVQPGPEDWWAGRKQHATKISFDLKSPPEGLYVLRLDLVDTHSNRAPRLRVTVNEAPGTERQLERGAGDIALQRPEKGKAQTLEFLIAADLLKETGNVIEIKTIAGSWTVYDAVSLQHRTGPLPTVKMTAEPTIFYVERDEKLLQELVVQAVGLVGAKDAKVRLEVREGVDLIGTFDLGKPVLGSINGVFHLPRVESPRQLSLSLICGEQNGATSVIQQPTRLWRIYCAPATHTDIGYTDIQDKVIALHNRNTDLALELIAKYPAYHWNLESSWAAQMWLRDRPAWRHKELFEASRQARLGIESSYLNMLTGLCSTEELIRDLYYSARLHRENGVPFKSHTLTDAPSHVWTVPTILANAGIKYLSVGVNQTRAPLFKKNIHKKSPFWWEGPDGSRVLTWFTAGYSQAGRIGLKDGIERMRTAIRADLYGWRQRGDNYPYDAILLHGAYSDNVSIGQGMARSITDYNATYAYPKVVLCSNDVFFEYIEETFPDKIPTVRGGGGSWWEDGAGSSAVETGINRVTHEDAVAAEAVWATLAGTLEDSAFPQSEFDRVWDNVLLYDEHTWGAHNSIYNPDSDFVHRQWAIKAAYATDAADETKRLLGRGLERLVSRVKVEDGSVLVFNPTGRARTDVVHVKIPRGSVIMEGETVVPQQIAHEDTALRDVTMAFVATDVPAVGYRTYCVVTEGSQLEQPQRFKDNVLENDFYRVTFDQETGAIASIIDKKLNKELVDAKSPYKLGQMIYAAGGGQDGKTQVNCPNTDQIEFKVSTGKGIAQAGNGAVYSSVKSSAALHRFKVAEMETILYEAQKRIDFVFRLNKDLTYEKEAVYIAFPIGGANPKFRYEIGAGSVRPNEDHFPGACRDWFAVQRWVTVNTDGAAVAWSALDTPLITLCQMTPGHWLDELEISNGTIFAYTMNNYWFTNYKAGQDGWFTFRYSLTSDASIDPNAASVFGEQSQSPLRATVAFSGRGQTSMPSMHSFCSVSPANVMLTALKRADDGKGIIARVRELAGVDSNAVVSIALPGVTGAARCDLVERDLGPLPIKEGKVTIPVKANSLATVRLK